MLNNNLNDNFIINLDTLKSCFEVMALKTQQNQEMLREAQNYLDNCKKDPQFPIILINFFDNANEVPKHLLFLS